MASGNGKHMCSTCGVNPVSGPNQECGPCARATKKLVEDLKNKGGKDKGKGKGK
jgi:hypothetical protein